MAGGGGTTRSGSGRSGGRAGEGGAARSGLAEARRRRSLVILPLLVVFYIVAFSIISGNPSRMGGFWAAIGIGVASFLLRPFVVLLVMSCLGAHVVLMRIGVGPYVATRATPTRMLVFRAFPITISCAYLPRVRHYGRDLRIMNATTVLTPLALNLLGSLLLPSYALPMSLTIGLMYTVADAVTRQPGSARSMGSRAFRKASAAEDPQLGDPDWTYLAHGVSEASFGDLQAAATHLEQLKARGHRGASRVEAVIQTVRGDYAAAVRVHFLLAEPAPQLTPLQRASRPALLSRAAYLILLVGERDAGAQERALTLAEETLQRRGRSVPARESANLVALRALMEGKPDEALALKRRQMLCATTPVDLADVLCTTARAQAATGKTEQAYATLNRAARIAPWYARVAVVQALLGGALAAAVDLPAVDVAGEARLFEDPWAAPDV